MTRAGGWGFGVGQGKPGVDGEERDFDGEAGEQGEQHPISLGDR